MSLYPRTRDPALPARNKRSRMPIGTSRMSRFSLVKWLLLVNVIFFNGYAISANAQEAVNLTVVPTLHDFGYVQTEQASASQTFTLSNDGDDLLWVRFIDDFGNVTTTVDEQGNVTAAVGYQTFDESGNPSTVSEFRLIEDNCSYEILNAEGQCEFSMTFEPQTVGAKTLDLPIPYTDAAGNSNSLMLTLTGNSVDYPIPNIEASIMSHDFGNLLVGETSRYQTIKVSNSGSRLSELNVGQISLSDTSNFVLQDSCSGKSLRRTSTRYSPWCRLSVAFIPQSGGVKTATLSIPSADLDMPVLEIPLLGESIAPVPNIEVNPTSLNFGDIQVGSASLYNSLAISNTGTGSLLLGELNFSGDTDNFELLIDSCSGKTIAPNKRCYLNIRFKPQAVGAKSTTLSIPSDDSDTPTVNVSLTGNGLGWCQGNYQQGFSTSPESPVDFGTMLVGSSMSLTQSVNTWAEGCGALRVEDITLAGTNAAEFSVSNTNCYYGQTGNRIYSNCQFNTVFSPTSLGTKNAEIVVIFSDTTTQTISLQATVVDSGEPNIELSPSSYDFGSVFVGSSYTSQIWTISNTGNVNLSIDSINVTGQNASEFSVNQWNCSLVRFLRPSEQCDIDSVILNPISAGNKQANLAITSNDMDMPTLNASLTGTAELPAECNGEHVTIQSINSGVWATKTQETGNHRKWGVHYSHTYSGSYDGPSLAWERLGNFMPGELPTLTQPRSGDVVLIRSGHTITGIPYTRVKRLCIEAGGRLESWDDQGTAMEVYASDYIENQGTIKGKDGITGNNPKPGAGIYLIAGGWHWGNSRKLFLNQGKIIAGNGGSGPQIGQKGGPVAILSGGITNTLRNDGSGGIILSGHGGDITGTQVGNAGDGGRMTMLSGPYLHHFGDVKIAAGDGGNCTNPNATGYQRGGRGGDVGWNSRDRGSVNVSGTFSAGRGGDMYCNRDGYNGSVYLDPNIISLSGANTKIEGGDIAIFGGKNWTLDLSNLNGTVLEATGDVTLAVGEGGVIDMTGSSGSLMKASGQVQIFADDIVLDENVALSDMIEATNIVVGPSKILRDVALNGPEQLSGEPQTVLPISLTLSNQGPEADTYMLMVTDMLGWTLGELPSTIEIDGLDMVELNFNVTLPGLFGTTDVITVSAISQNEPEISATVEVQVTVTEPENGTAEVDQGILNVPGVDTMVEGAKVTIVTTTQDGILDLSNVGDTKIVTSTDDIILAVGANGVIDLTGNNSQILETTGKVIIYADSSQVLSDVDLSILLGANYEIRPIKPSRDVSLTGPSDLSKPLGSVVPVKLTLVNEGLEADAYTISVTDTLGLPLTGIPPIKRVKGLDSVELLLNVGLIATVGTTDVITVTATSQADSSIVATTTVQVTVTEPPSPSDSDISDNATTVVVSPTSPLCRTTNGVINRLCRNDGQELADVTIEAGTSIAGGQMTGTVTNNGLISQVTIKENAIVTGGKLTGYIVNEGTLVDFEFVGARVEGGILSGTIRNNSQVGGVFKNVRLAANTSITGGAVQGDVEGDAEALAVLENVTIKSGTQLSNVRLSGSTLLEGFVTLTNVQFAEGVNLSGGKLLGDFGGDQDNLIRLENTSIRSGSRLSHVIIGDNVEMAEDVVLGQGVRFANVASIPTKRELMGTLPELLAVEIAGVTYPNQFDLSADVLESGNGLLSAINDLPFFTDNGWSITQNSELGYFELTLDGIRYAVLPASVQKLTTSVVGMELQDALSVNFNTESGLAVLTHPALQAPSALQSALADLGLNELIIQDNGNLQIPSEDDVWYSARPDWLSTELVDADAEAGINFGDSPYLGGLFSVSMIFDAGGLREQVMYSAVAYPEALYSSATNVSIGAYGLVNFRLDGEAYSGVVDYVVTQETQLTTDTLEVDVEASSDMNGDGIDDFVLNYSTGEQQILFALP